MPYKKKSSKKRSSKKRVYKKRTKSTYNRTTVNFGLGFPKKMIMTHKYFDYFNVSNTGGAVTHYMFSCNGLFDPDYTSTGHQPMYFDQAAALWDHYTCIGSKIKFVVSQAANTNASATACLWLNDDTSVTPTLYGLAEQTSASRRILPAYNVDPYTLTKKWSPKKIFGGSILANDNLQGTASANPTEQTYYCLSIFPQGASTQTYNVQVYIEYITVWDELKDVNSS